MNKIIVSAAPHIHSNDSVKRNMRNVVIALIPALLVSLYFFGIGALAVTLISIASCVGFEYLIQKFILKVPVTIHDGSALLTGLLLAFNVPANLPWWILILGALIAIGVGKQTFGGLGNNIFNPALVGRVFMLISFPAQMTSWPLPTPFSAHYMDAETGATTLSFFTNGQLDKIPSQLSMLLGNMGGSMGEVSALALLLGLVWLLATKTITWHIPVSILATVFVFTGIFYLVDPTMYVNPISHLLAGGLLLGAIFMATDYVTSPMHPASQIVFGIGIGVITCVIRMWGSYPEGMSFAILIMNAVTPLLNNYMKPHRYGIKQTAK